MLTVISGEKAHPGIGAETALHRRSLLRLSSAGTAGPGAVTAPPVAWPWSSEAGPPLWPGRAPDDGSAPEQRCEQEAERGHAQDEQVHLRGRGISGVGRGFLWWGGASAGRGFLQWGRGTSRWAGLPTAGAGPWRAGSPPLSPGDLDLQPCPRAPSPGSGADSPLGR